MDAAAHDGELLFGFVLEGSVVLECRGSHALLACDAYTIPAGETWALTQASPDLLLLEVSVAGP
jgi:hypothetical protein